MKRLCLDIHSVRRDLAKNVKVRNALCLGMFDDGRREFYPEFGMDMARCIDAITVDTKPVDPDLVDLDKTFDYARIGSGEIVKANKIAHHRILALERRVAAIVIILDVVHPCRDFYVLFGSRNDGRISLVRIVGAIAVGARAFRAFCILDDIGAVVGDDVHIDLHPALVRRIDERFEFGIGAEMRVYGSEIGHPIAVIARRFLTLATLHRLVLENRRKPDRGGTHALNIIEPFDQPRQIPAVEKAFVRRVEAGLHLVALKAAFVISDVAIFKTVG